MAFRILVIAVVVAGCFDPSLGDRPFRCQMSMSCPSGYECVGGWCTNGGGGGGGGVDAAIGVDGPLPGDVDAPVAGDARAIDARPRVDAPPIVDGQGAPDACAPGTFVQCQDENVALVCSDSGYDVEDCAFRCNDALGRCEQCDPGKPTQCAGNLRITCSPEGRITGSETCPGFCLEASGGARCAVLEPTNLPRDLCDQPAAKPRRFTADLEIKTDTCTDGTIVPQTGGPAICLLEYTTLVIDPGVLVSGVGRNALAFAADTIQMGGYISVSAEGVTSGAGAVTDGTGHTAETAYSAAGGGAGFGTAGGLGGTEDVLITVAGGPPYGNAQLSPLIGGSRGGRAGTSPQLCTVNCPTPASGGGGGGALQLVACKQITFGVVSRVLAVGGGAGGGFQQYMTSVATAGGGAGGGSGGAILIESPVVEVQIAAFFAATGGGGGGGGGLEEGTNGGVGEDGQPDRAAFGGGRGSPYAGRGGGGGIRDAAGVYGTVPADGETVQLPRYGAGGGGGAAGRIRFNTAPTSPIDPRTFIVLPYPSVGSVAGH